MRLLLTEEWALQQRPWSGMHELSSLGGVPTGKDVYDSLFGSDPVEFSRSLEYQVGGVSDVGK